MSEVAGDLGAVAPPAPPARIQRISLKDFRAFPGTSLASFELEGKNLLVYGENGAGKSSLFHALRDFFSIGSAQEMASRLAAQKNAFSGLPLDACSVEVTIAGGESEYHFSDSAVWSKTAHPAAQTRVRLASGGMSPHRSINLMVRDAARRAACLDYKALLDTNYKQGTEAINLFELAIAVLLRDFRVTVEGGTESTISDLWQGIKRAEQIALLGTRSSKMEQKVRDACVAFNVAFRVALERLLPKANEVLQALGWHNVVLTGLSSPGVTYQTAHFRSARKLDGLRLTPEITFRGMQLDRPQLFLNEARLSGLALALYLGGRLACVPSANTQALKLLVLDDVLVGLDQSNRIPVLDVIEKQFRDWQVVLLTHDRLWFETVRARAQLSGNWTTTEIFAGNESDTTHSPVIALREIDVVEDYLLRAERHLSNSDWRAASVYARSAFEMWLKIQCAAQGIPIQYSLEPRKIDSNVYFNAIEKWADNNLAKPAFSGMLKVLALYRDTVFNPGSHSYPTTMSGGEQKAAITAMRFANGATKHGASALQLASHLINKPGVTPEELALAAGFLRVAFMRRLRELARGKPLMVPFTMEPQKISPSELWTAMTTAGWPLKRAPWVAGIDMNKSILLDAWTWPVLLSLSVAQLQSALQAVKQH